MITFAMPEDQALLAAIGKAAVRHGQLDYGLRMTVKSIAGVSIGEALDATERTPSGQLRQRIAKLAKRRFGESATLVRLQALLTRARRATDRRNALLHGLFAAELDGRPLHRSDGKNWGDLPAVKDLEDLADELFAVLGELNRERLDGFLHRALQETRAPVDTNVLIGQ
jgi:hypothetical protein